MKPRISIPLERVEIYEKNTRTPYISVDPYQY